MDNCELMICLKKGISTVFGVYLRGSSGVSRNFPQNVGDIYVLLFAAKNKDCVFHD